MLASLLRLPPEMEPRSWEQLPEALAELRRWMSSGAAACAARDGRWVLKSRTAFSSLIPNTRAFCLYLTLHWTTLPPSVHRSLSDSALLPGWGCWKGFAIPCRDAAAPP